MSFAARLTRCPIPFDAEAAARLPAMARDLPADLRALLQGAAGCSPYLAGLIAAEADWLADALDQGPDPALAAILTADLPPASEDCARRLRRDKGRLALLTGLADLGGVWPLEQVTGALTRFADRAVDRLMRAVLTEEARRGRLPGISEDDARQGAAGMVALAMGKMGAAELNYSSDIDLICLYDETQHDRANHEDIRAGLVRVTRRMTGLLSDRTAEGYIFRTDLRLRPDASVTPVCLSMGAAEQYYEA
jgi:[glutamine synthetase] adenylyltransferase / [glutamine synthetase]-adenylyl-L-tyrosine phosphorylase